jgi:hypothetical protein
MESNKIDQSLPDIIEAGLLSKFLNDPRRLTMTKQEQLDFVKKVEYLGEKLKEKLQ